MNSTKTAVCTPAVSPTTPGSTSACLADLPRHDESGYMVAVE